VRRIADAGRGPAEAAEGAPLHVLIAKRLALIEHAPVAHGRVGKILLFEGDRRQVALHLRADSRCRR
jgi:hypothetical protein